MIDPAPPVVTEPPERSAARPPQQAAPQPQDAPLLESDLLVEDVSIDGMCGVY